MCLKSSWANNRMWTVTNDVSFNSVFLVGSSVQTPLQSTWISSTCMPLGNLVENNLWYTNRKCTYEKSQWYLKPIPVSLLTAKILTPWKKHWPTWRKPNIINSLVFQTIPEWIFDKILFNYVLSVFQFCAIVLCHKNPLAKLVKKNSQFAKYMFCRSVLL